MPNYSFVCKSCDHKFDEMLMMKDNDKPIKCPCPNCKKKKVVRDWTENTNSVAMDATLTPLKVMGNGWNDVINKVKKSAPRHMQDRLEQSRTFNGGRFVR
jgi:putative FmdB family regulatory protein